jgi:hypothetical protein
MIEIIGFIIDKDFSYFQTNNKKVTRYSLRLDYIKKFCDYARGEARLFNNHNHEARVSNINIFMRGYIYESQNCIRLYLVTVIFIA